MGGFSIALPEGTKCTGVTAGNLCLLSVKTTVGFGACVVVSQLDSSSGAATAVSASTAAEAPASTTVKVPCSSSRKRRGAVRICAPLLFVHAGEVLDAGSATPKACALTRSSRARLFSHLE
ncbi:hypothetical protein K438DRAFT_1976280 [Mycena galopus ATCC 62051]|nr:hypothetical protein K438DRAFT_1976280 [Mycena galopus ATCC 62051]